MMVGSLWLVDDAIIYCQQPQQWRQFISRGLVVDAMCRMNRNEVDTNYHEHLFTIQQTTTTTTTTQ
jgi:hypothetical protein